MPNKITSDETTKNLKSLGKHTDYPTVPSINILETFEAPADANTEASPQYVLFTQDVVEFTSLCPVTEQPDFGKISILYLPRKKYVESKSLKLYLFAFRNTRGFGEAITNRIAWDLMNLLDARFVAVKGDFNPRGGIRWTPKSIVLGQVTEQYDLLLEKTDLYKLTSLDERMITEL